jgi:hypothetical protein
VPFEWGSRRRHQQHLERLRQGLPAGRRFLDQPLPASSGDRLASGGDRLASGGDRLASGGDRLASSGDRLASSGAGGGAPAGCGAGAGPARRGAGTVGGGREENPYVLHNRSRSRSQSRGETSGVGHYYYRSDGPTMSSLLRAEPVDVTPTDPDRCVGRAAADTLLDVPSDSERSAASTLIDSPGSTASDADSVAASVVASDADSSAATEVDAEATIAYVDESVEATIAYADESVDLVFGSDDGFVNGSCMGPPAPPSPPLPIDRREEDAREERARRDGFAFATAASGPGFWASGMQAMHGVVRTLMHGGSSLPTSLRYRAMDYGCHDRLGARFPAVGAAVTDHVMIVIRDRVARADMGLRFYVGITEDPVLRFTEPCEGNMLSHSDRYASMTIVQEALSSRETAATEREVIARCEVEFPYRCNNVASGGQSASGGSPHYVYVCWQTGPLRLSSTVRLLGGRRGLR